MYTIFVKNKPIFLNNYRTNKFLNIPFLSANIFPQVVNALENEALEGISIYHFPVQLLFEAFQNHFQQVHAAGARVKNPQGKTLFIYRKNKWDLPKGKIEKHENPQEAALREVGEECGIFQLKIIRSLKNTYHIYKDEHHLFKTVHWFDMYTDSLKNPIPQKEEGIVQALWKTPAEVKKALTNTYQGIRDLFSKGT